MLSNETIQKYMKAPVKSSKYGTGHVSNYVIKDSGKHYIYVLFDQDQEERAFAVDIAFQKGFLSFVNEEYNTEIKRYLERETSIIKPETEATSINDPTNVDKVQSNVPCQKPTSATFTSHPLTEVLVNHILNNESITLELISHFDDSEFEKALYEEAFLYLERIMSGATVSKAQKACIVCAFSLIALKQYDGNLHAYIEANYRDYRAKTEKQFPTYNPIRNAAYGVLSDYRVKTQYFDLHSYVAVPIILCCVPHYRLPDLFRISYDIYKKKLLFDENVTDEQIEEKVYETLTALNRKDLISDSDTIKGTNYLMSKYTQSCIYSGYGIHELSRIIAHCIRLIISYLTRPEDSFRVEPYYVDGYKAWIDIFEADDQEREKFNKSRTMSQPYFKLIDGEIHLFTGAYNMDDIYDPNDVHICVRKGNEVILDYHVTDPDSIEYVDESSAMSGIIVGRQEIAVYASPLDDLSYQIICSDETLYDSKERLFRHNIFFDGKGNEVKPGTDYSGEIFVVSHITDEEDEQKINLIHKAADYLVSVEEVNNHEVFYFDGEPYTFFKISSAQIISHNTPWGEFRSVEGKDYPIYRDAVILFPASCDMEDIHLEIDGEEYYYGDPYDVYYSIRVYSKEYDGWAYTVKIFGLEPGYHTIRIINDISGKQVKGASFGIVYDHDSWKTFVAKNDTGIHYDLVCNFTGDQELFYEFGVTNKEIHGFVKNLGHGNLVIYPSSISYSIDGNTWFDGYHKTLLCDIPESTKFLTICGPGGMKAFLVRPLEGVKKQEISFESFKDDPRKYKLFLSLIRTSSEQQNMKNKEAEVLFEGAGRPLRLKFFYNPKVRYEDCHFYYNKETKQHCFRFSYEGSSKLKAVIKPLYSDETLLEKTVASGDTIVLNDADIDEKVKYLSVSLCGRKYGALLNPFRSDSFMTFPKYDLGRGFVRVKPFPPELKLNGTVLSCAFTFMGTPAVQAQLIPSGFATPLKTVVLREGDIFSHDIKGLPFNSYKLFIFGAKDDQGEQFYNDPACHSQPIKVVSPYLKKKLKVTAFILEDGTKTEANYSIWFKTIEEIDHKYYLIASLTSANTGKTIEDIVCSITGAVGLQYEADIWQREENILSKMKLVNGQTLKGIVIEQIGGWV